MNKKLKWFLGVVVGQKQASGWHGKIEGDFILHPSLVVSPFFLAFLFGNDYRLTRSCKTSVERPRAPSRPLPVIAYLMPVGPTRCQLALCLITHPVISP